ncbi:unnamed protein product [Taenia asiatica]|uniref:TPR_REGION domain-containing protein n=1 Tax=Taenia asiatica TaxID=60517 RepID=A0A0R3VY09_TAEAS|nr:unnamed protein product [Taenia asiatica]
MPNSSAARRDENATTCHLHSDQPGAGMNLGPRESLLSNMALCQLKAGCPSYAVKLCTQALEMAPRDAKLLAESQEEEREEEDGEGRRITLRDVEKVLYRRASAYLLMEEFEAGIEDANRLLQLNPTNQAGEKVLGELQASLRAHNATMARMMKKAFQ